MKSDAKIVLLTLFALLMVGIVLVYSSSAVYAYQRYGDSMFFLKRHLMFIFMGTVVFVFFLLVPFKAMAHNSKWVLVFSFITLFLVIVPGVGIEAGGARRWIRILGFGFQPSEGAKIALILYLADFTSRKRYLMRDLTRGFIPPVTIILLMAFMILMQPDMGTAIAVIFIGFVMLYCSGIRIKHIVSIAAPVLALTVMAILWKPYRLRRVVTFMDPWSERSGAGFQLVQSFIALGSGGITGVGLGQSKQKLFYLPEAHTDFVFAILGEELGFLGSFSVLMVLSVFIFFIFRIAMRLEEKFSSSFVMGIGIMMSFEVIVNVGVSTGILPTKGLPLPFISYGGSSLFFNMIAVAIVLNLARENKKDLR